MPMTPDSPARPCGRVLFCNDHRGLLRPHRDSKARAAERTATLRNDPQCERSGPGAGSLRSVAETGALDESLDDSSGSWWLRPEALVGVVETALAAALRLAAQAQRWELVARLAEELAARRRARTEPGTGGLGSERLVNRGRSR
jgi:hypothetical protein